MKRHEAPIALEECQRNGPLRIGMIGLRGVPARYSGVEVVVEEVGSRLAQQGHEVTVYCMAGRYQDRPAAYRGMKLRYIPTVSRKNMEMIVYAVISSFLGVFSRHQVIHYHALGPSTTAILPRLVGKRIVVSVHGLDWQRGKWSLPARLFLRLGEWTSARLPHATIAVSQSLRDYYLSKYDADVSYIPNGAVHRSPVPLPRSMNELGIEAGRYLLFVGRITKEKGVDTLVQAFRNVDTDMKLVIVGGSSHTDDHVRTIRELADEDDRVVLAGPIYGDDLAGVFSNAFLFVLPSYLEGLPIVLLEALSFGVPVLVSDIAENTEVIRHGDEQVGWTFRTGNANDLSRVLCELLARPDTLEGFSERASALVADKYDWDSITDQILQVYRRVLEGTAAT